MEKFFQYKCDSCNFFSNSFQKYESHMETKKHNALSAGEVWPRVVKKCQYLNCKYSTREGGNFQRHCMSHLAKRIKSYKACIDKLGDEDADYFDKLCEKDWKTDQEDQRQMREQF